MKTILSPFNNTHFTVHFVAVAERNVCEIDTIEAKQLISMACVQLSAIKEIFKGGGIIFFFQTTTTKTTKTKTMSMKTATTKTTARV